MQGEHHNVWAPGVHEDDIPGVGHSDELFLQWDPWRGEQHTLNSEDSRLSLEVSTLYSALYILYTVLYRSPRCGPTL